MKVVTENNSKFVNLKIDLRFVVIVLIAVIVAMTIIWRPWQNNTGAERTISETGETTIKATPDEYVFNPTFESSNADQKIAKQEVSDRANIVVGKIKELGIADDKITLDVYGGDDYSYPIEHGTDKPESFSASANIEIVVDNKDIAQKVQDYLDTTNAKGQLTPQAKFSKTKQSELETQAQEEAIEDAKAKAEQSAKLLGVKVGKVVTVSEGSGFDGYPIFNGLDSGVSSSENGSTRSTLPIQAGQNEFYYSVTITFGIK